MYRADFTDDDRTWASNALRFNTQDEAVEYARDLFGRWFGARAWRVVPDTVPQREPVDHDQDKVNNYPGSGA